MKDGLRIQYLRGKREEAVSSQMMNHLKNSPDFSAVQMSLKYSNSNSNTAILSNSNNL